MYELIVPNHVKRDMKKVDRPVLKEILRLFEEISENPFIGLPLKGNFHSLYKIHFQKHGVDYRMVYEIVEEKIQVEILHVGSRENFYKELKRRL